MTTSALLVLKMKLIQAVLWKWIGRRYGGYQGGTELAVLGDVRVYMRC